MFEFPLINTKREWIDLSGNAIVRTKDLPGVFIETKRQNQKHFCTQKKYLPLQKQTFKSDCM